MMWYMLHASCFPPDQAGQAGVTKAPAVSWQGCWAQLTCLRPWADFVQDFPAWHARDGRKCAPVSAGVVQGHDLLGMCPLLCALPGELLQAPALIDSQLSVLRIV